MAKVYIPDDWTETNGYTLFLLCVPDSFRWRGAVMGQIQALARGRTWDEETGSIKAAQAIGWQIYDSLMTCKLDDLVTAVNNLNATSETNGLALAAIANALTGIQTAIQASGANVDELEDDLANVWRVLQSISGVLGGDIPDPPNPW